MKNGNGKKNVLANKNITGLRSPESTGPRPQAGLPQLGSYPFALDLKQRREKKQRRRTTVSPDGGEEPIPATSDRGWMLQSAEVVQRTTVV